MSFLFYIIYCTLDFYENFYYTITIKESCPDVNGWTQPNVNHNLIKAMQIYKCQIIHNQNFYEELKGDISNTSYLHKYVHDLFDVFRGMFNWPNLRKCIYSNKITSIPFITRLLELQDEIHVYAVNIAGDNTEKQVLPSPCNKAE